MTRTTPMWRTAAASTLSILSLSACALDPALLAAVRAGQLGAPGQAGPALPEPAPAASPGLSPGGPPVPYVPPTSGGIPTLQDPMEPEGAEIMDLVMAVDAWLEEVERVTDDAPPGGPEPEGGGAAYTLRQTSDLPPPPPPQDGGYPPPPGGNYQPPPGGNYPPPPGGNYQPPPDGNYPPPPDGNYPPPPGG
ncbi:MAG: hypothetical protein VKQ33_13455, partial [Candidatus Sericytochromatia bacterium]|nr:hypothetical protein [Candidatus Sericytochromatia bacterium]